jgi:hypothetical protein
MNTHQEIAAGADENFQAAPHSLDTSTNSLSERETTDIALEMYQVSF